MPYEGEVGMRAVKEFIMGILLGFVLIGHSIAHERARDSEEEESEA